jgi:hypothetical protein
MDELENHAANLRFLTTHPGRFEGEIIAPTGERRGEWTAHICNDAPDLCRHLDLSPDVIAMIEKIHPEVWPLAFLNSITVSEDHRDSNFGSKGLIDFIAAAVDHNCQIALVRIGWSVDSPMEKNLHFYLKNGWNELFEKNSKGVPSTLALSFYDLSSGLHSTPDVSHSVN